MVNENNNINLIIKNEKPFETVQEVNNETPTYEEFLKNHKGVINYDDLNSGNVGEVKGYGPTGSGASCRKYCYYCRKDVSVRSYSDNYCSECGTAFGTVNRRTTGIQKLNEESTQRVIDKYGDKVEKSGGEVRVKIGDEDVEVIYKKN